MAAQHFDGCFGDGWTLVQSPSGPGGKVVWFCAALFNAQASPSGAGWFEIYGTVLASAEGSDLTNVAESVGDNMPVRPIDEPLVTYSGRPRLSVDKEVVPTYPVAPGNLVTYTLTYSNVTGTDPGFADFATGDFSPLPSSPCVDRGGPLHPDAVPDHLPVWQYLRHQRATSRPDDGALDLGALESGTVFADGFESGGTGAWSWVAP